MSNSERSVIYRELPEASQNLRLWEMTEAQQELTGLAAMFRAEGVDIRFESDELPERGLRFVRRMNLIIGLMDEHVQDFDRFHSERPYLVSERELKVV